MVASTRRARMASPRAVGARNELLSTVEAIVTNPT
jgi:hypothetical protein